LSLGHPAEVRVIIVGIKRITALWSSTCPEAVIRGDELVVLGGPESESLETIAV
jgi:hypothetical protein